jgi:site-specific DNA-methyltransferase (adenine-specific)
MNLCPECQPLYDGWLDFKRPAARYVTLNNPQRSLEARSAQIQATRALQNQQLDMIVDSCRSKHQEPAPAVP